MKKYRYLIHLVSFFMTLFCSSTNAWLIDQSYDSQVLGDFCEDWQSSQSFVSDIESFSGNNSCLQHINAGTTGFGVWGGIISHPVKLYKGDEVWIRFRTFFPIGFNYDSTGEGGHLKFIRFHTRDSVNSNYGYDDIYIDPSTSTLAFRFIYEGDPKWANYGGEADKIVLGVWETYEYYVKFDNISKDAGGGATVRFWKNGVLLGESTDLTTLKTADSFSDATYIFTYWNGASPRTQEMYIDDLVITSFIPGNSDSLGNKYIGMGRYFPAPKSTSDLVVQ